MPTIDFSSNCSSLSLCIYKKKKKKTQTNKKNLLESYFLSFTGQGAENKA